MATLTLDNWWIVPVILFSLVLLSILINKNNPDNFGN